VTDPPGEFIYNLMGSVGFSASRNKSWAVRSVDGISDTFHQTSFLHNFMMKKTYGSKEDYSFPK
jgi:hypothetical protein